MKDLISLSNSKLAKDGIATFGIPAIKTCPNAGACKAYCYAAKGFYRMPAVVKARERNLAATKRKSFEYRVIAELQAKNVKMLRVHDAGDFYSEAYFRKWLSIARALPHVKFYAYTKMVSLARKHSENTPPNFKIIFSLGGTEDRLINLAVDNHARVFKTKERLDEYQYKNASVSDLVAVKNRQIGLVLH